MSNYSNKILDLLTNPTHTRWLAPLLILSETLLCSLIVWRIPYTEIDWSTYQAQIKIFLTGETNYAKISGPTGPLVYPAVHVYIYTLLHYLTERGENIFRAQLIFAGLYLCTLSLVVACYRRVGVPPWVLGLVVLSKRMHSIFLLRLFNDAWACLGLWGLYIPFAEKEVGGWSYCLGTWVGVKMILLLAAPGLAMVMVQGAGTADSFFAGMFIVILQLMAAIPFIYEEAAAAYVTRAFDFGRQFLFEWTVNWRFVGEELFLSKSFAISLLVLHVSILLYFLQTKWIRPSSSTLGEFIRKYTRTMNEEVESRASKKVTPTFVMDTILGSMVIGLLCARSLHYQFYAYLGWATPYLLWRAGFGPIWVLVSWAIQEYCWLVFPSTKISSALVVFELAIQVLSTLIAPPVDHIRPPAKTTDQVQPKVKT